MTLLKKISGIRGTIGGKPGTNLTPVDIVDMVSAYGTLLKKKNAGKTIVVGRDGRISGEIVSHLAVNTLLSMGFDVIDLGLSTTPTVEMAVPKENAAGGIIFTASHNPKEWNALKLLNEKGEFISGEEGEEMLRIAQKNDYSYAEINDLGKYTRNSGYFEYHIEKILALPYLNLESIRSRAFKVVVDCINSTGALALPPLLKRLNCETILINEDITGEFQHDPEPLPVNLTGLSQRVLLEKADLGIAVDPDVDRLVFVNEDGSMFGEEFTLVAIADFILQQKAGPTVSNMSSTRALADVTQSYGQQYHTSAVGEVNVVNKMKEVGAVIGGEGNGGVILPELHYGRDALVGIALMLNHLTNRSCTMSELKRSYPSYVIIKMKFQLKPEMDIDIIIEKLKNKYIDNKLNEEDGLRIDFEKSWVHLRKSNTEPVVRIIAEAETKELAEAIINPILTFVKE